MQLKTPKDLAIKARMLGKKTISYSQFSRYKNCPKSWKLAYIDKEKSFAYYKKWNDMAKKREKHPRNERRPLWMNRPLAPKIEHFYLKEK